LTTPQWGFSGPTETNDKQIMQMNIAGLKISTGRRKISWLSVYQETTPAFIAFSSFGIFTTVTLGRDLGNYDDVIEYVLSTRQYMSLHSVLSFRGGLNEIYTWDNDVINTANTLNTYTLGEKFQPLLLPQSYYG